MENSFNPGRRCYVKVSQRLLGVMLFAVLQAGCLASAVDTAVDTSIAVAKVPFKIAGAAVDVATRDDDDDDKEDE